MSPRSTKIEHFPAIDQLLGMEIYFASELEQITHSFKFRAAWSVVNNIEAEGFIAASSGNFGQALACACQRLGKACVIVMPTTSAQVKINAVYSYGAEIIFVDTRMQSRAEKVHEVSKEYSSFYVASAYDCEHVISGNASLGVEIAHLEEKFDLIIAPIGGGGLAAGIIRGLRGSGDETPVWGAEPFLADDLYWSLKAQKLLKHDIEPQTLADGARTLSVGRRNWTILKENLINVIQVSEEKITQAVQLLWKMGLRVEPTGALTLGGLLETEDWKGKKVLAVISGGNVDPELFERLIGKE
jgi:threonine dehydratase